MVVLGSFFEKWWRKICLETVLRQGKTNRAEQPKSLKSRVGGRQKKDASHGKHPGLRRGIFGFLRGREMGFGGQKRIRIWYHAAPPCSEEEMPSLTKPNLA